MKTRRFLAWLMVLLLLTLAACSGDSEKKHETTTEPETSPEENIELGPNGEQIFEGTGCLFENESCSFTLRKAEIDSLSDYNWGVTLTNSTDEALVFTVDNVYVNDILFDPYWAVQVDIGANVEENIIWSSPEMEARGITQITRIDLTLRVTSASGEEYAKVDLTDYPSGKSAYIARSRSQATTDVVVLDNESYQAVITGDDPDNRWGFALELYLENRTEQKVIFTVENVTVNGEACDPQWRCELPAGKKGTGELVWFDEDLSGEEVRGMIFDLVVKDTDGNTLTRQSVTYNP